MNTCRTNPYMGKPGFLNSLLGDWLCATKIKCEKKFCLTENSRLVAARLLAFGSLIRWVAPRGGKRGRARLATGSAPFPVTRTSNTNDTDGVSGLGQRGPELPPLPRPQSQRPPGDAAPIHRKTRRRDQGQPPRLAGPCASAGRWPCTGEVQPAVASSRGRQRGTGMTVGDVSLGRSGRQADTSATVSMSRRL